MKLQTVLLLYTILYMQTGCKKQTPTLPNKLNALTTQRLKNTSLPLDLNAVVYTAAGDTIYAINATTGIVKWNKFCDKVKTGTLTVYNGVVYVGNGNGGASDFYALDATTGAEIWRNNIKGSASIPIVKEYYNQTVVYVCTTPAAAGGAYGYIYAIDAANGKTIWSFKTDREITASPTLVLAYLFAIDVEGNLYALKASNGTKIWQAAISGSPMPAYNPSNPTIDLHTSTLYVGGGDANLYAFDGVSGGLLSTFTTLRTPIITATSPTIFNGKVYIATNKSIYAIDMAKNTQVWKHDLTGLSLFFITTTPIIYNNLLYASQTNAVLALNAETGVEVWRNTSIHNGYLNPVAYNGVVYGNGSDSLGHHFLYALDAAMGTTKWSCSMARENGPNFAPCVVSGDGTVYNSSASGDQP